MAEQKECPYCKNLVSVTSANASCPFCDGMLRGGPNPSATKARLANFYNLAYTTDSACQADIFEYEFEKLAQSNVSALIAMLKWPNSDRWCTWVLRSLSRVKDGRGLEAIKEATTHKKESVRQEASRVLRLVLDRPRLEEEARRRKEEKERQEHCLAVQQNRRSQRQCIMCGNSLGLVDRLMRREKHPACNSFVDNVKEPNQ
jgi:hypothetical protein